jgi:hypothetical protein
MNQALKLIVEEVDFDSFQYLVEEKNSKSGQKYYIEGPMILLDEENQNGRLYESEEMDPAVEKYIKEYVEKNGALGEMNHPNDPDINPVNACDMITSLRKEGNHWIGKAVCLSTPMGKLQESLIRDGVRLGKSTRCLGQIVESNGKNLVKQPNIRAIDTVMNPSGQGQNVSCFVNGILENKDWNINYSNNNEQSYDIFEKGIATLPRQREIDAYLTEQITKFINSLS